MSRTQVMRKLQCYVITLIDCNETFETALAHGWVEACANGQVGCMGGLIDGVGMGGLEEWLQKW